MSTSPSKESRKSPSKKLRMETSTSSPSTSSTMLSNPNISTNPLHRKQKIIETSKEKKLENVINFKNCELKYWPLLNFLNKDLLLQIEKVMFYAWDDNSKKNFDSAFIVTKHHEVYILNIQRKDHTPHTQRKRIEYLCQKRIKTMISSNEPCLFVLTEEGQLYSWGKNINCKLGHGLISHTSEKETMVLNTVELPTEVNSLKEEHVVDIKCGSAHVLVLTNDSRIYSWGHNNYGQVGAFDEDIIELPIEVIIEDELGKKNIRSISCGSIFSIALTYDGTLYGWGGNQYDQLGFQNNEEMMQGKPMKIMFHYRITKLACGFNHMLALTEQGFLYVWGKNDRGQLGIGSYQDIYYPTKIHDIAKVTDIIAHFDEKRSAIVTEEEDIYVWGSYACHDILYPHRINLDKVQDVFLDHINILYWPCVKLKQSNTIKCLKSAFNDKVSSDVTLVVSGQSFYIHKTIIKIRCPEMYKQVFMNDPPKLSIQHDSTAYEAFLKYLYTDVIDLPNEKLFDLFQLATLYNDKFLIKDCYEMIRESVTVSNVMDYYAESITKKIKDLENFCFNFAVTNLTAVVNTDGLTNLTHELYRDFIKKASNFGAFKH